MHAHTSHRRVAGFGGKEIVAVLVLLVVVVMLGFFFFGKIVDGYEAARLLADHKVASGRVTESGARRKDAKYNFDVNGQRYWGTAGRQNMGDSIVVAYLPADPAVNRPEDGLWIDVVLGAAIVLALPIGLLVIIFGKPPAAQSEPAPDESPPTEPKSDAGPT